MEIKRVGLAFGGCAVYWFEGLGYWRSPKGISLCIYKTKPGVRFISQLPGFYKNQIATACSSVTPDWIKEQIAFHCSRMNDDYGLFGTVSKTIDYYPTVSPIGRYYQLRFTVPEALRDVKGYSRLVRGRPFLPYKELENERSRMIELSKQYQQEFIDLFRLTMEDATAITDTCPTLIKRF